MAGRARRAPIHRALHAATPYLGALVLLGATIPGLRGQVQAVAPFEKLQLSPLYYSEGADIGDFNQDGVPDVVSGPLWWEGPDFAVSHVIHPPIAFPILGYSTQFLSFAGDLDGDGWDDVLAIGFPGQAASWYRNPQQAGGLWAQHLVFGNVGAESPSFQQLVGSGARELICASGTGLGYLTPDPASPYDPWIFHTILQAPVSLSFLHGLGVGDVDGDGRLDVLTGVGWLEQPASLVGDPPWPFHGFGFGPLAGAQMFAYDVDGDGDNDLVSSLDAHGYGLSWFESASSGGTISFTEHVILPSSATAAGPVQFSQLHALGLVDVDGDGLKDIVTGKTFLAHNGTDPGAFDPAVAYWFELVRSGGTATFTPHLIDDDSGLGRQVMSGDLDGDGRPDLVSGNKSGVFIFRRSCLWADLEQLSLVTGGTQHLYASLGAQHAAGGYWIVGSASGTAPGVTYAGLQVPLNPDGYTALTLSAANTPTFSGFLGTFDPSGQATASFALPAGLPLMGPILLHHAFLAWDAQGALFKAGNAVPLLLL